MDIRKIGKWYQKTSSRRDLLRSMATLSAGIPILKTLPLVGQAAQQQQQPSTPHTTPAPHPVPTTLSPEDDAFLNELEHANFLFFWEQTNPETGLTKDRSNVRTEDKTVAASIASTGFALTAVCIGENRGFSRQRP